MTPRVVLCLIVGLLGSTVLSQYLWGRLACPIIRWLFK